MKAFVRTTNLVAAELTSGLLGRLCPGGAGREEAGTGGRTWSSAL